MKCSKGAIPTSLVLLGVLASICSASAQLAPIRKMPFAEHDEGYDNPPAPPRKLETSPQMVSQFGVFTSYQVNVTASHQNIIGDATNECVIAVDPTDPSKMTIGWRQFNDVTSNFRQGGWGYTTDAGLTWSFPGVLENNVFRSDPVIKANETGNFFTDAGVTWSSNIDCSGGGVQFQRCLHQGSRRWVHWDGDCYTDSQRYVDFHGYRHSCRDRNTNSHGQSQADAYTEICSDSKTSAHSTAETVIHSTLKTPTLRANPCPGQLFRASRAAR